MPRPKGRLLGVTVRRPELCPQLRLMSTACHRSPTPETKKRKNPVWVPEDGGISKEISWLQDDIAANPCPESTRSRQEPAMSHYHGAPSKPQPEPKEKRRHSRRSRKKAKRKALTGSQEDSARPKALIEPKDPTPPRKKAKVLTESQEGPASLIEPKVPASPIEPEVPTLPRSEVTPSRMQLEVIDLTGED
ncbi:hypothetical protein H4582DRAFT_2065654 [Lactarius indigo]|nr:hypothetical protein H4582DRAFT_2065654 [Lactarius indigo]